MSPSHLLNKMTQLGRSRWRPTFRMKVFFFLIALLLVLSGVFVALSIPKHVVAAGLNPIQIENNNPGTPNWDDFSASLQPDLISGFGSQISVNHGGSIDFYVTTTAPSFTIDIFRTGYYQGIGARLMTSLGSFTGVHQAIPQPDPVTGMIACTNWTKTTTLQIPSSWVTGVYLAKLTTNTGNSSFIFFVVRDDGGHEDLDFQTSVTTYQAYNTWGGTSLYNNLTNGSVYPYAHATKVSFDRPFNPGDSNGAGHYFFYEYKFVYWLESQGYNVTYTTDVDTDTNVNPITNHKGFLSVGHDEYWSNGMRTNVQNAINAGVNVAFFSANAMYWQIRFEANAAGVPDRVEVGYKDFATDPSGPPGPDPLFGVNNALVTTNWRDPTVNQPENGIIGVMFEQQVDQSYAYVVQDASSWIYDNTGFVNGSTVPGIVGYEYDKVWSNGFSPAGLTILSNSPVHGCCGGFSSFANSTIYTAPSGARVFAGGTIQWSWGLANIQGNTYANAGIQQTTANILNNFINGPTPSANLSPGSLNFNAAVLNTTTAAQTITLLSNGTAPLNVSSIALTGANAGDFAQTNNCPGTLGINASCTISVTFTPSATGTRNASLTVTDNATGSPQSVTLVGIGQTTAAPVVTLTPTSVSFGTLTVGNTSVAQTVTLTNNGALALTLSSIAVTGTNAGDFAQSNLCPSTLAVGSSCAITVTFTPAAGGSRSGALTFTDNAVDSPESVALSGTGAVPTIYFSDGFESGNLSAWTLSHADSTGTATVQSNIVNSGLEAAALTNSSGQYVYLYTALPGGPQSQTFTRFYFQLSSLSNGSILAIARNANGGNTWEMDYDAGRKGLDLYFWNSSGGTYTIFTPTNALTANTWYYVEVQDTQTTTGQAEFWLNGTSVGVVNADLSNANPYARLMLFNGAPGTFYFDDVQVANIYNGPVAPAPAVTLNPTSLNFGSQGVGTTSVPLTVTLANRGNAPLNISSITITGPNAGDFSDNGADLECPATLSANATCTLDLTFTPSALGARSATLTLTDNAQNSPQSVALSGLGVTPGPGAGVSPTSLSFGNQNVGATGVAQTIALTSNGTQPLSNISISISGANAADFAQTNTCPTGSSSLAVNTSCTINVTFTPGAAGSRSASITIADNATSSPQSVSLSGTGVTPTVYFADGFETGNLSQWTLSSVDSTGTATVQTTTVYSGTYAASLTNSSGQYVYLYTAFPGGPESQTFTRFYFRLSSLSNGTILAIGRNANGGNVWEIDYDANRQGLDIYFWANGGGIYTIFSPNQSLTANTWYYVELQDLETTTGQVQAWLNGTSLGSYSADFSTANPYARLMLFNGAAGTITFDDVKVANTYNGPYSPGGGLLAAAALAHASAGAAFPAGNWRAGQQTSTPPLPVKRPAQGFQLSAIGDIRLSVLPWRFANFRSSLSLNQSLSRFSEWRK